MPRFVDLDLDVDVDLDLDPLDDDLIPCAQVCHLHFICVFSGNCRILLTCRLEFLSTPETSFRSSARMITTGGR